MENHLDLGHSWLPFRQLNSLVKQVLGNESEENFPQLESVLINHKKEFISLLKNSSKNVLHREIVQNASKDGITIIENQNKFKAVLSQEMISEALLLSDMFNLNELSALELLITGENQLSRYPEMSRGTIAVLYYYDNKRSIISTLQILVQARNGRTWTSKLPRTLSRFINKYTDDLKSENIVLRCLEILEEFDIIKEFEMLETNRALGPYGYRKQVLDIMKDIRKMTSNIIFNYAAQTNFTKTEIFKLFELLSCKGTLENYYFDVFSTDLLVSLLYAYDVTFLQNSDDSEQHVVDIPWIKDSNMITEFVSKLEKTEFSVKPIKSIIQFSFGLCLKILSSFSSNIEIEGYDERLIDKAVEENVFENLVQFITQNNHFFKEEFFVRRIHSINADFFIQMPHKIKELRDKADESERILNAFSAESIKPFSNLALHFEKFLNYLADFYFSENFGLSNEFWIASGEHCKTISQVQQTLHKFVRSLHESYFPQALHSSVIKFFRALARSSPFNVFSLIKNTSFHTSLQFSISSFSESLSDYLMAVQGADNAERISASSFMDFNNIYSSKTRKAVSFDTICAIVNLIEEIVKNDRTCCIAIAESQQYTFIPNMVFILRCAVPRELKANILKCFAAFASMPAVSPLIWKEIDGVLPRYNLNMIGHQKLLQNGIAIEIEEIEVKNEEYPITIGFLELMSSLFSHYDSGLNAPQKNSSDNSFNFILDSILLKSNYRVFKNNREKWIIVKLAYKILFNIVKKSDFVDGIYSFNVFSQILQENLLFRHIMSTLEEAAIYFDQHTTQPTLKECNDLSEEIEECTITILSLLKSVCDKQDVFFEMIRKVSGVSLSTFVKFDVLFNNINPKTNKQDRFVTLFKLIPTVNSISIGTLKLLNTLCSSNFELTYLCLMQISQSGPFHNPSLKSEILIHMFVECLESDCKDLRLEALSFIDIYLGSGASTNSKYNFAHKLVGIESKMFSLKNVSMFGQIYTCLHSILSLFDTTADLDGLIEERKLGMQIIYKLCFSVNTQEIVLRVLRSSYEFNSQYLKFWNRLLTDDKKQNFMEKLLLEMAYFMKILAIDVRITSDQKLKSYYSSYVNFLFRETKKPRIIEFLSSFSFFTEPPEMQSFDYFEIKELIKIISECLNSDNTIDLPLLHQKLFYEIRSLGAQIGFSSSALLREEINKIMFYSTAVNKSIQSTKIKNEFIESWCELVQIIILSKCFESMEEEVQSRYLTEIILELINRVLDPKTNYSFYNSVSSTILIVSSELNEINSKAVTNISSCIRSILHALEKSPSIWSQQKRARINFYGSLLYLFRLLPVNLFKELKFSSNLLDKLTKDVLAGHEVAKMLSISILNRCDPANWLNELVLNGTLKQLLASLLSDDRDIRANKYEFIKAFYVFESKMMLLLKIFSSSNVNFSINNLLNNLDIVSILESMQIFDLYPYLICENPVCFKMFQDTLRLMITITTTNNRQIITEIGSFMSSHSILYDIIRIAPTIKDQENGQELLLLVCRLLGRLVLNVNKNLQVSFVGLLSLFCDKESIRFKSEIVFLILNACVYLISFNPSNPIFEPSLINTDSQIYSKHTIGLLVSIINICNEQSNEKNEYSFLIIENSLYLIWAHLNIYFNVINEISLSENFDEISTLKTQSESIFNEAFFSTIKCYSEKNTFIESISRKIKRLIHLKPSNALVF